MSSEKKNGGKWKMQRLCALPLLADHPQSSRLFWLGGVHGPPLSEISGHRDFVSNVESEECVPPIHPTPEPAQAVDWGHMPPPYTRRPQPLGSALSGPFNGLGCGRLPGTSPRPS